MLDKLKMTAALALIFGLIIGIFIGATINQELNNQENENKASENESSEASPYIIRGIQLQERIKAYYGVVNSIKESAGINENQDPEKVAEKVRKWLGDESICRYYSTLTFTILAEQGYENLTLRVGHVKLGNENREHIWLTWENKSLDYPYLQYFSHISENEFTKKQLWESIST